MAEMIAAFVGAVLWIPVYRRRPGLMFSAMAFVLVPQAIVSVFKAEWMAALYAAAPGVVAVLVDIIRLKRAGR